MKNSFRTLALMPLLILTCTLFSQVAPPAFKWSKGIGGFFSDIGSSITTDSSGNVITAGVFSELVNFNPGGANPAIEYGQFGDAFVTKHDSLGNLIWVQQIGGEGQDGATGAVTDKDGNIYVIGYFEGTADLDPNVGTAFATSLNGKDIFITKLNSNGDFIWSKHLEGGGDFSRAERVIINPLGLGIYITGSFSDTLDFDPNNGVTNLITEPFVTTGFLARYSEDGELVWAKQFEGVDYGMGVSAGINGNIFLTGIFSDTATFTSFPSTITLVSNGQSDIFIAKFKGDGELLFARSLGSANTDWGFSITNDKDGNVLVTGMFSGSMDFDPGAGEEIMEAQGWDVYILKLNDAGEFLWAKSFGGQQFEWGNAIVTDKDGSIYTTGFFNDTADFDPSAGVFELVAGGYNEIFIHKLDANGNFVWAGQLKGSQLFTTSDNQGFGIEVDKDFNIYLTGQFYSFIDSDPGPLVSNILALDEAGGGFYRSDFFIVKLEQESTVGIENTSQLPAFKYFPNPTSGVLSVNFDTYLDHLQAEIVDLTGKVVSTQSFSNCNSIQLDFNVSKGLYFVRLKSNKREIGNFKVSKI